MDKNIFATPLREFRPTAIWFWNAAPEAIGPDETATQLAGLAGTDGYSGIMPIPWGYDGYFNEGYLEKYRQALEEAERNGLSVMIWDENGFPSGGAGGLMEQHYPEHTAKRLDLIEADSVCAGKVTLRLPEGRLMSAVAMNMTTFEIVDITDDASPDGRTVEWEATAEGWKVMAFVCVKQTEFPTLMGKKPPVDYLDREAVNKFIELTHEAYFKHFAKYFGGVIKWMFYDEPAFWHVQGGRIWTGDFNVKFRAKYGYDPTALYPAMFYDIGPGTEAARNALFGFRAELYAEEYIGTMADWCEAHGILLTGHMDQEEIVNPTAITGDVLKVFSRQHMPGVDEIFKHGRGQKAFKLVTSSARNYDRDRVMCEVFGAMGERMPVETLYKEAMDLFAKGVNFIIPHAAWYDARKNITFPPELSFRSAKFGPHLPHFNEYCARCSYMLQGGRHVADIAVLYPIHSLQGSFRFGPENPYEGGVNPPEADYLDVGDMLANTLRRDYIFLHPEVLEEKCELRGRELQLTNEVNRERFKVLLLPGMTTVSAASLRKAAEFYRAGGCVIATTQLPVKSAEPGFDAEIAALTAEIFGAAPEPGSVHTNGAGGRSCFVAKPDAAALAAALDDMRIVPDVLIEASEKPVGGYISYIHKQKDGRDIYFIENSGDGQASLKISLHGEHALEAWDPATGDTQAVTHVKAAGGKTEFELELPPVSARFIVG